MTSPYPWTTFTQRTIAIVGPAVLAWLLMALGVIVGLPRGIEDAIPLVVVIVFAITVSALCRRWAPNFPLALVASCAIVAAIVIMMAAPIALLNHYGREITATVIAEEHVTHRTRSGTQHEWHYQLADAAANPLHGRLVETSDWLDVGDRVHVIQDPAGLADPQTPDEIDDLGVVWALFAITAVLTVLGALALSAWSLSERRTRREQVRLENPGGRTWFRPLGHQRRMIGRAWFAFGLATAVGGICSMIALSGPVAGFGILLTVGGSFVALLSSTPAFGRDNRTQ